MSPKKSLHLSCSLLVVAAFAMPAMAQWTGTNPVTVPQGTSVGIGAPAPDAPLHIIAAANATQFKITAATGGTNISLSSVGNRTGSVMFDADTTPTGYRLNNTEGIWLQKAGAHFRVLGATTTTPPAAPTSYTNVFDADIVTGNAAIGGQANAIPGAPRFEVVGASLTTGASRRLMRLVDNSAVAQDVGGGIDFDGKYIASTGTYAQFGNIKGVKTNGTDSDQHGDLAFSINNGTGTLIEGVRLTTNATDATKALLTVTGDINVTGNVNAKYQDVAEWVPAASDMPPGTVVVLNRARENEVMPSRQAYDTAVAGVVSSQPGIILGEASSSKAKIATTGRVRVRVDATTHPVGIGDLLVTSDKPGLAMVSTPLEINGRKFHQPGTVIGKALQELKSGEGEILVLLSLQ